MSKDTADGEVWRERCWGEEGWRVWNRFEFEGGMSVGGGEDDELPIQAIAGNCNYIGST